LVVAFLKRWLVIDNFMEVREASRALRMTIAARIFLACG
jgi:hypothetical protein